MLLLQNEANRRDQTAPSRTAACIFQRKHAGISQTGQPALRDRNPHIGTLPGSLKSEAFLHLRHMHSLNRYELSSFACSSQREACRTRGKAASNSTDILTCPPGTAAALPVC